MSSWKRPESVLVLVYTVAGQVLLLERTRPAGFWQSVTGSLEPNESPAQAASRELAEETGMQMVPQDAGLEHSFPILPEWRSRYHPDVMENREYLFSLELETPCNIQLNPNEHKQYEWLDWPAAIQRCASWTNQFAIEQIVKPRVR